MMASVGISMGMILVLGVVGLLVVGVVLYWATGSSDDEDR
jgi:hypothetical protein